MDEASALIDQIIEEHKIIMRKAQTLEEVANDVEAIAGLDKAKEAFMPGTSEQKQGLEKLQEALDTIEEGVKAHFDREETALLAAFKKHGDKELASAFHSLLLEHEDIRSRLAHSKKHIAELTGGELSRHVWEASAHDMRAHISHTRKLLQAHASIEQELFQTLRSRLTGTEKGSD